MELKTYQARSMSDALAKVKSDMGGSAVILHTRTVKRGGLFGIGARPFVEITATNDPRVAEARAALAAPAGSSAPSVSPVASAPRGRRGMGVDADKRSSSPTGIAPAATAPTSPNLVPPLPSPLASDPTIRREIETIRDMVADLARRSERPTERRVPADLLDYYTHLISQDVAEELAVQIVERALGRLRTCPAAVGGQEGASRVCPVGGDLASPQRVQDELHRIISEMLPEVEPLKLTAMGRPTIVALVGPTGVGKTTTIAKLAANAKLREGKSVGLITIDTYRIAAVEQLKVYAQILDVPLAAVVTPQDMQAAVRRMSHLDLVLIDTAGRSQRDEPRIAELGELLATAKPDQVHLVLATTAREPTIREAIARFSVLGVQQLIFTKIDEAVGFGVLLNVLDSVNLRLSYLTTGQSVPKDIEQADRNRIASLIVDGLTTGAASPVRKPPRLVDAAAQAPSSPDERGE